jgi:hypothetical protein
MVLHIAFLHEYDRAGPIFREILGTQDILEFFTEAMVQGSLLRHIIAIKISD